MTENPLKTIDPRDLIQESYRIEGITEPECRSIFFDWAMSSEESMDSRAAIETLLAALGEAAPAHPMTAVLREGLAQSRTPKRRGGARSRSRPS